MPSVVTDDACDVTLAYTSRDPPSLEEEENPECMDHNCCQPYMSIQYNPEVQRLV
jgi:hypothetical protein